MLVHNFFDLYADRFPNNLCIVFAGQRYSFSEVATEVDILVAGLQKLGLKSGDRIALLGENCPEYIHTLFAASKLGCVVLPLNYRLAPAELIFIIADSQAKLLLVPDDYMQTLLSGIESLAAAMPAVVTNLASSGSNRLAWSDCFSAQATADESLMSCKQFDENSPYLQIYTSGTTGHPKGVLLSHRNLSNAALSGIFAARHRPQLGSLDLVCAPNFHIGGSGSMLIPILAGGGIVLHKTFDPASVIADLQRYPITTTFLVPAMILAIVSNVPGIEDMQFPNLKQISYGASPINSTLLKKALSIFECDFYQLYGLTESTGAVISLSAEDHLRALDGQEHLLASCGRAQIGVEIIITDEDGNQCAPNEIGEILIKSGTVMLGYHGLAAQTAEAIKDGWLQSGDSGAKDEEGYIYIKDRIKDMVVSGGENIYPVEVENALAQHPAISDIAVIGVPDEKFGEALMACLVLNSGQQLDAQEIVSFCRDKLAGYKIPRQLQVLDALPRNPSGKVLKTELRKPFWIGHDRSVG
jgi:acyl-CoA synthetase (AMP-forming)/AMP-acid ligase II